MPDLSDHARKALAYWPQIEYAAANRMTTADLWSTLQDAAEELGMASPGVSVRGVNELRSLATRIQTSGRNFERVADDVSLTGRDHISEAPWSRPLAEQGALSIYQVRYQHTVITPEGPETAWRTSIFQGALPGTAGELRSALQEDAEQMAAKYGVAHADLSSVQILSV